VRGRFSPTAATAATAVAVLFCRRYFARRRRAAPAASATPAMGPQPPPPEPEPPAILRVGPETEGEIEPPARLRAR